MCLHGEANLCIGQRGAPPGVGDWPYCVGTYADYCYVHPQRSLYRVPDEIDDEVFRRCHRYVYSRTSRTDYHVADPELRPAVGYEPIDTEWLRREERLLSEDKRVFLSEALLGRDPGRESPEEITCFVTPGIAIQFAASAHKVYEGARERGLGRKLPLSWFLQDISD